jgi:hypothetical protein
MHCMSNRIILYNLYALNSMSTSLLSCRFKGRVVLVVEVTAIPEDDGSSEEGREDDDDDEEEEEEEEEELNPEL